MSRLPARFLYCTRAATDVAVSVTCPMVIHSAKASRSESSFQCRFRVRKRLMAGWARDCARSTLSRILHAGPASGFRGAIGGAQIAAGVSAGEHLADTIERDVQLDLPQSSE